MICKRCGTKFSDGIFCPECGARTTPVSGPGGEEQTNTWENALQYSEEEGYNTKMYGPQGQLQEQRIAREEIKVDAGGKRVFENKKLIFENNESYSECIQADKNATLEFRNCILICNEKTAIGVKSNVSMKFDHCLIKGREQLIREYDNVRIRLEFRGCAFDGGQVAENSDYLVRASVESIYFENCFIKDRLAIAYVDHYNGLSFKIEFRNCVIINNLESLGVCEDLLVCYGGDKESFVEFDNCFIRSKARLIPVSSKAKLIIKNCYFDDYSYTLED